MKNLMVITLVLFTLTSTAQNEQKKSADRKEMAQIREDMSPKDIAGLKSKKMTLRLDLTDAQQQKLYKLILAAATERQQLREERQTKNEGEKAKPTKDEMVNKLNTKLDKQIAFKREMKEILTEEQYKRFEKMSAKKPKRKRKLMKNDN